MDNLNINFLLRGNLQLILENANMYEPAIKSSYDPPSVKTAGVESGFTDPWQ